MELALPKNSLRQHPRQGIRPAGIIGALVLCLLVWVAVGWAVHWLMSL